jgi:hypothetical protein
MPLKSYEHCCSSCIALSNLEKIEGVIPILHGPQACAFGNQIGSMFCRPSQFKSKYSTIFTNLQDTRESPSKFDPAIFSLEWDSPAKEMLKLVPEEFLARAVMETENYA